MGEKQICGMRCLNVSRFVVGIPKLSTSRLLFSGEEEDEKSEDDSAARRDTYLEDILSSSIRI